MISQTAQPPVPCFSGSTRLSKPRKITMKSSSSSVSEKTKLPILLFDVMDILVRDPSSQDVPANFGMPMKELLGTIHPSTWIKFEKGQIDEGYLQ